MPTKHQRTPDQGRQLREALAPYLDVRKLRKLTASGGDLQQALRPDASGDVPPEVTALLSALRVLLRPSAREHISGPADVAALLMVEMSGLEQEELRVVLLSTNNHVLDVVTVYRGTINASTVRIAEIFREAIRRNAASVIVAHNHPSGDPTPSPEDVRVTRELIQAGNLLGIEVLDHVVTGKGSWVSLRERGLW